MAERALTDQEVKEFRNCSRAAFGLLAMEPSSPPQEDIEAIEEYILRWHQPQRGLFARLFSRKPDVIQAALALGAAWGDQLVREFGWEWTCYQSNGQDLYCVATKDRSMAIFPTYFVKACLDDPSIDCTIALAFNMLKAKSFPKLPASGFQNLMESVHRIVPR